MPRTPTIARPGAFHNPGTVAFTTPWLPVAPSSPNGAIAVSSCGSMLEPFGRPPLMPCSSLFVLLTAVAPQQSRTPTSATPLWGTAPPHVYYNTYVTHFATPSWRGGASTPHYNAGPTRTESHPFALHLLWRSPTMKGARPVR